ncbi:MAG TPA: helix-hairpin-helix domain-containing protein [Polyangia bacterium]|jgi:competence protein ComEA
MRRLTRLFASCIVLAAVATPAAHAGKAVDGVVNLNTAEPGVLGLLPGIGPAKAAQIVAYRRRHPFRTVDELVRIKGIGRKMVRRLRAHLAVAGPTTAAGIVVAPGAVSPPAPPAPPPAPPARARPAASPARPSGVGPPAPVRPPLAQRPRRELRTTHGICPSPR